MLLRPSLALVCFFVTVTSLLYPASFRHIPRRALLQLDPPQANSSSIWVSHQCLWSAATATAVAVARADASGGAATATAVAAASAVGTVSAGSGTCSLNPSYFFSLAARGRGPAIDSEKVLLQITAMRYTCLNHTVEAVCSGDQANWCVWQEDKNGKGRCELYFGDADFVHFLMWSGTKVACAESKVAQVVKCSFEVSAQQCAKSPGCEWTEGACYPDWFATIITKPKLLAKFKRQVQVADPEVWGTCVGADLYRQYSSICNHQTQEACKQDPAGCTFVGEHEAEVVGNPLNYSKPCILSSARFPLESVFLGGSSSPFAAAVLDAQKSCRASSDEMSCDANTTALNSNVLETAMNYSASTTNSTQRSPNNPGSSDGASIIKKADAGPDPDFTASWGLPVAGPFKDLPVSPPTTLDAAAPPVAAQATNPAQALSSAAKPPLPALQPLLGGSLSLDSTVPASTSVSASASVSRSASSAGDAILKNLGAWMKPIQTSEAWSGLFGAAEFPTLPGGPTQLGTWKAATVSLRVLHIMPVFPRGKFCDKRHVSVPGLSTEPSGRWLAGTSCRCCR